MVVDERYMQRALQLAEMGEEWASPNPLVGAVVVAGGRIIGEGYHQKCGEPHAEVNAIRSISEQNRALLSSSTIYVTLEPCSHYGRTPPCAKLIIESGIPRVVVGVLDPFEKVSGRGIKMLEDAGIEVVVGVMEQQCREVNRHFFTSVTTSRPYVLLKWAESSDGYIGVADRPVAITAAVANTLSHRLRARFDAILVGTNTAVCDDCSLTVRRWFGSQPLRVVVDRCGRLATSAKLLSDGGKTLVFTQKEGRVEGNVEHIKVDKWDSILETILDVLSVRGIRSLMVEGGAATLQSFIDRELWNEAYRYRAPLSFNQEGLLDRGAVKAPAIADSCQSYNRQIGADLLTIYRR